ncbi:MAG TPA: dihydrofolate reductase family protein [Actinomycetota bacterium]|jgi:dihydrofolate reductase|nr:dihydrofolate reductase family protein [Actinomycetota bacterium]
MRRVVVLNHVTLDGVIQGPGRADEDTRDGFEHGGWAMERNDDVMGQAIGARMAHSAGLLLGRRSYDDMLAYWNTTDSPFKDALNNAPKFVASYSSEPVSWPNSTLLSGDVPEAVAELRQKPGDDLHIMGSGALIQSLMPHGLIDEYMLMIHPLVLGSGRKLFPDTSPRTPLRLVDSQTTTKGVVIATYQPV